MSRSHVGAPEGIVRYLRRPLCLYKTTAPGATPLQVQQRSRVEPLLHG